jgi:hypothetical protein
MKEPVTPITISFSKKPSIKQPCSGQFWRLATAALLLSSLIGCATVAPDSAVSIAVPEPTPDTGLASANVMYNTRNYTGAIREFDTIIADADASANSRRLSHLGKSLIYLSTDKNWHSIENAKMSLNSAGQIVPEGDEEFAVETDMFMDSITALIGAESENHELQSKTGNSSAEIARLKEERTALANERDALLKEQQALSEALEKLKNLTLGS